MAISIQGVKEFFGIGDKPKAAPPPTTQHVAERANQVLGENKGPVQVNSKFPDYNENGLPKSIPGGDPVGTDSGGKNRRYATGPNFTTISENSGVNASDDEATKARQAQADYRNKMNQTLGTEVANPPTAANERAYLQKLADGGANQDKIKEEYQQYAGTFYHHPGGGVDWNPKLDTKNLDQRFAEQPIAKNGKRLIDCEGFAAMGENVLGGLKQKNGQPMYDVKHGASSSHVVTLLTPHGGDPRKGMVVNNDKLDAPTYKPEWDKLYNSSKNDDQRKRWLLNQYLQAHDNGSLQNQGNTYADMKPPPGK